MHRVPVFWISRHLYDGAIAYSKFLLNVQYLVLDVATISYLNSISPRVECPIECECRTGRVKIMLQTPLLLVPLETRELAIVASYDAILGHILL